jgi:hypothetical protein
MPIRRVPTLMTAVSCHGWSVRRLDVGEHHLALEAAHQVAGEVRAALELDLAERDRVVPHLVHRVDNEVVVAAIVVLVVVDDVAGIHRQDVPVDAAERVDQGSPPGQPPLAGRLSAAGVDLATVRRRAEDDELEAPGRRAGALGARGSDQAEDEEGERGAACASHFSLSWVAGSAAAGTDAATR